MERRFFLIDNGPMMNSIWMDLRNDARITVIKQFKSLNAFFSLMKRIHLSKRVNSIIHLPFKDIWCRSVKEIEWDKDIEYYIIFENTSIYPISPEYLNKMQKKYHVHYILFMVDPWMHRCSEDVRYYSSCVRFDYIFSFDPEDVKKYGLIYSELPFSMFSDNDKCLDDVTHDLFFIGIGKDRLQLLLEVYKSGTAAGVNMLYMLDRVSPESQKYDDEIIYLNKKVPYKDVVELSKGSNCILEIISAGQSGATTRYYEAVCYNKKLLTTNKNVVNLPFYNADYIHVFEKPEDIDWDWVKKRIHVDYHYDGRFSPSRLIDRIIELEDEKERRFNEKEETS